MNSNDTGWKADPKLWKHADLNKRNVTTQGTWNSHGELTEMIRLVNKQATRREEN